MTRLPLALCLLLAGYAPARAETPKVVADIAPVHSLVAQVMKGVGEPVLLIDGSGDPHGGSLRPSQARALAKADLMVWIGKRLTPWLSPVGDRTVSLGLLDEPETITLAMRKEHGEGEHDGHGHEHKGHDHGDGIVDPHAWLDPENGAVWLDTIAAALAETDPENAATYRANAKEGAMEIEAVKKEIEASLAAVRDMPFAVGHDAFHYFEDRFGVESVAALSSVDGERPGARRVREVASSLAERNVTCLFAEPDSPRRLIDRVAEGAGAKVVILDQLGATLEPGPDLYPAMLRRIGAAMAGCLSGT